MKKRIVAFTLMLAVFCGGAYAANTYKKIIEVEYGIGLSINGKTPTLADAKGNAVQPFTYNGTTYVPIRAVGENMGAKVGYDDKTNVASVASDSATHTKMINVYGMYRTSEVSHRVHEECLELQSFYVMDGLKDGVAAEFKDSYDTLSKDASTIINGIQADELYRNDAYVQTQKSFKTQYEAYQQMFAAFFNFKSGSLQNISDFSNAFKNELDYWSDTQQGCYTNINDITYK